MAAASDYLEDELLDHALGTGSFTAPSAVYVALFTAAPNDAGGGTELSGDGYARQECAFDAASGGSASNTSDETFTASGGDWGTITHVGLFDASTSGNLLFHGALSASQVVNDGGSLIFSAGSLTVSLA